MTASVSDVKYTDTQAKSELSKIIDRRNLQRNWK